MRVADFVCRPCGQTVHRTVPWWKLAFTSMCDRNGGRTTRLWRVNWGESL